MKQFLCWGDKYLLTCEANSYSEAATQFKRMYSSVEYVNVLEIDRQIQKFTFDTRVTYIPQKVN